MVGDPRFSVTSPIELGPLAAETGHEDAISWQLWHFVAARLAFDLKPPAAVSAADTNGSSRLGDIFEHLERILFNDGGQMSWHPPVDLKDDPRSGGQSLGVLGLAQLHLPSHVSGPA